MTLSVSGLNLVVDLKSTDVSIVFRQLFLKVSVSAQSAVIGKSSILHCFYLLMCLLVPILDWS